MSRRPMFTTQRVIGEIRLCICRNDGTPPTIEELRQRLGCGSTRTVLRYLKKLEDEGYLKRWHGARGMKINARRQKAAE